MKLSIRIADPAGNITIFVLSPVPRAQYAAVAAKLLQLPKFGAEQVAFEVPPQLGGEGRIEMMGGEFCGNATRSYGYLRSILSPAHPTQVTVEISGAPTALLVEIDHDKGCCKTQMPLLNREDTIRYEDVSYSVMVFDGIVHLIVPGKPRNEAFVRGLLAHARTKFCSDAYGVMFLEGSGTLVPVVYVVNTDSLIWESSCGSGSMACAAFLALHEKDGIHCYSFAQPGGTIDAEVATEHNIVTLCKMGGPVCLSDEIVLTLDD